MPPQRYRRRQQLLPATGNGGIWGALQTAFDRTDFQSDNQLVVFRPCVESIPKCALAAAPLLTLAAMASELQKCCRVQVTSCLNGLLNCRLRSMKCPALVFAALVCLLHSSSAAPRLTVADAPHEISCGAHAQPPFIALVDVLGIDPSEVAVHAALGATPPLHLPTLLTRVCPRSRR